VLRSPAEALPFADRVVHLLAEVDSPAPYSKVLQCRAVLRVQLGDLPGGLEDAEASLRLAATASPQYVPQFASIISLTLLDHRQASAAVRFVERAIAHGEDRDPGAFGVDLLLIRARARLQLGELDAAAADVSTVMPRVEAEAHPHARVLAMVMRLCLAARTGGTDDDARRWLEAINEMPLAFGEVQLNELQLGKRPVWTVEALLAEVACLRASAEQLPQVVAEWTDVALQQATVAEHGWSMGELRWWRREAGWDDGPVPAVVAEPWRAMLEGRWTEAAALWQGLSAPYEQAWALSHGSAEEQRSAITLADSLGALGLADRIRARLRAAGEESVPSRPRSAGGAITQRQVEILALVAQGLSSPQIAERLHISPKTAANHVAAILTRLGAATRAEAVAIAVREGLLLG
jgi:DNA-binding CsgD family transcriptional regulator